MQVLDSGEPINQLVREKGITTGFSFSFYVGGSCDVDGVLLIRFHIFTRVCTGHVLLCFCEIDFDQLIFFKFVLQKKSLPRSAGTRGRKYVSNLENLE
jgi:hypothetical protein